MKKNIFLVLVIITALAIFLVGCASDETPSQEAADQEESTVDGDQVEDPEEDVQDTAQDNDHNHEVEEGMAPDFMVHTEDGGHALLENLAGQEVSLEDYRGKIVFLNFWATWCQYCSQQMPDIQSIHEEMDDVVVIAVNVNETKEEVEQYMEEGGYSFEVLLDKTGEVAQNYLVAGFPTTYTIREDGSISHYFSGMLPREAMDEMIDLARGEQ